MACGGKASPQPSRGSPGVDRAPYHRYATSHKNLNILGLHEHDISAWIVNTLLAIIYAHFKHTSHAYAYPTRGRLHRANHISFLPVDDISLSLASSVLKLIIILYQLRIAGRELCTDFSFSMCITVE